MRVLGIGAGQILFTGLLAFECLTSLLGMTPLPAFYAAVALTISSTIIIVKLLSDKRETEVPAREDHRRNPDSAGHRRGAWR